MQNYKRNRNLDLHIFVFCRTV